MKGLNKRDNGTYHLRMRVPKRFLAITGKKEIHRSLKTDDKAEAAELAPKVRKEVLEELENILTARALPGSADAYRAAQALVQARGFEYLSSASLLETPLEETLARLDGLSINDNVETARALLGGIEEPGLRLSELVAVVNEYRAHDNRFKDDDQLRKWLNPRKKAVSNLMEAISGKDIPVGDIDAATAAKHKLWWQKRIAKEGLKPETANKDFVNMRSLLRDYYSSIAQPNPPKPYADINIEKDRYRENKRKKEIPVEWIEEKWFAEGALDGINHEARDILLMSIESGCRQSEISNLPPYAIVLDHPIPHLKIQVEEGEFRREVKNAPSQRLVPLVGVSLAAAKRHPTGFPKYRGSSSYSGEINTELRSRNLLPSDEHTVGGVRHTFESRMKKVIIPNDDRGEMMGHSVKAARNRETYGDDMELEEKLRLANLIVLPVPPHLT
ncbi:hypothetical protein FDK21_20165 [Cohaesibacter sp. CAU 1516]|uniref:DUF6538 domain-containing protein n=1 Tax=Cohaesibacter sp. CAU 1516 TaxID=2576038 RepID=UPI0010FEEF56|nr:DUF6538 domain-containing protein [Cohaesibacter sp. CAU 1516]TLP42175.1 hypothetical protein FDK21_20165 [Cohaesibacter sp. CAU 1516]